SGCSLTNLSSSDQAALDSLLDAGSDLSKVHPFDFYIYHPDESGEVQICSQLRADGFQVTTREGAIEGEWLCLAGESHSRRKGF
ncbi:MAG: ribonuclease E inhibitor RraB, partial [Desulfobulbaceae bacterium]|nr:ribonuclease E inhibitor RraB [Desulfobulbaceae bacterium]